MKKMIVDTSSTAASVAVLEDGLIKGEFTIHTERTHSEKLMPMIESLMRGLDLKIEDIDEFVVCEGPGSFTGVRIGISTVKAFAQPFDKPIKTFTSMKLLSGAFSYHDGLVLSMVDAKRDSVYYGLYRWHHGCVLTVEEGVKNIEVLLNDLENHFLNEHVMVTGDATWIYRDAFKRLDNLNLHNQYVMTDQKIAVLSASNYRHIEDDKGEVHKYNEVKANYMKKSQAERDFNL
ncbi:MAG: tRNA (adenosine(37)-N6)-threonylcarbamoyltransferase complex dimerization subunit type 1 TsaB [Clostridia bacterium]|nr:tRNA (adenosine(37)-N6)-threonylcarbamoyltransferase complex dimerization subunit type 1 TsaB [Clostridia bacterium]